MRKNGSKNFELTEHVGIELIQDFAPTASLLVFFQQSRGKRMCSPALLNSSLQYENFVVYQDINLPVDCNGIADGGMHIGVAGKHIQCDCRSTEFF